jgi:hypothetical protein
MKRRAAWASVKGKDRGEIEREKRGAYVLCLRSVYLPLTLEGKLNLCAGLSGFPQYCSSYVSVVILVKSVTETLSNYITAHLRITVHPSSRQGHSSARPR